MARFLGDPKSPARKRNGPNVSQSEKGDLGKLRQNAHGELDPEFYNMRVFLTSFYEFEECGHWPHKWASPEQLEEWQKEWEWEVEQMNLLPESEQ